MINEFLKKLKELPDSLNSSTSFISYIDSEGHTLKAEDILFLDEENYRKLTNTQSLDDIVFYTSFSSDPDIIPIYDDTRIFPEAMKTADGKRFPLKVSRYTYELLPKHAGSAELVDIIFTGPPSSGKTITTLEYTDPSFHDMIASQTNLSIQNDIPLIEENAAYEDLAEGFFQLHFVPPSTHQKEYIRPYVFYLSYSDSDQIQHMLLRLQDIDGEACLSPERMKQISFHNDIFLMIGADEITDNNTSRNKNFFTSVNNLITELNSKDNHSCSKLMVVITKADLLFSQSNELYSENSVEMNNNKLTQTIHACGFDFDAFQRRSSSLEEYLRKQHPNFLNTLNNSFTNSQLTFSFIANIGSEPDPKEHIFDELRPFSIDEPLLYILCKNGFYPTLKPEDNSNITESVNNCFGNHQNSFSTLQWLKKLLLSIKYK